jgi:MFS family permease
MAWAGWLFDFYDLMLLSFLVVPIQRALALSQDQIALLMGVSLASTAVGGLFFGWLADRWGRKPVLSATILTYSIGAFCCGMASDLWMLLAFRIVTGLGVGGEWATGQTLVGETFPAKTRARYASLMQTGAPAGIALATLVGAFGEPFFADACGAAWGWRICFFISVLPALLVIHVRRSMPESDVWEEWQRHPDHAASSGGEFLTLLKGDAVVRRLYVLCLVLALTDMSAYWFTYIWMPQYLYDQLHLSLTKSGAWMLVTQVGGVIGYASFGVVADWKGRRIAYSLYSMLWAAGLFSVTVLWTQIAAVPQLALFCMFIVGLGTGNFSGYGPIFSELFTTRVRNTAMGSAFNLARGVQFFTPLVITWVAAHAASGTAQNGTGRDLGIGISIGAFFAIWTGLWIWTLPETRGTQILAAEVVRAKE